MNVALFRKELRELLPWGVLGLALGGSNVVQFLLEQVDLAPLGQTFRLLNTYSVVVYFVIAFAIGTGLAIREHDDRTLAFLDGLPVSRSRVFLIKCAVMAVLILFGPLLELLAVAALHLLSRGSLDHDLRGGLLLQAFGLQTLLLVNGLMLGAAFGRLRSLAWAAAGLAAAGLIALADSMPRAALLNPLTLLDWQWTTTAIVVDAEILGTQLAVTALAAMLAWHGFVHAGKSRVRLNISGPVAGAAVAVVTVGIGIAVLVMVMRPFEPSLSPVAEGGEAYQFPPSPPAQTVTRRYRISYLAHQADAALALAEEADAVFEQVHALLGLPPGDVIDVDASGSAENTHGTAFFGRLRMNLDSDAEVLAVLAHETAHVAAQRAAGAERDWLWQAANVLSEGLASWVETRFRGRAERADERMLLLAAMHSRRELIIEELADPALLQVQRDDSVKYAAGEALISALVRLHGEGALARLLQAFDDPRLPSDLKGLLLWQSTFQLAGFDLAAVVDEFYRAVDEYAKLHEERIAALPRPRVVLVRIGNSIGAMPVVDAQPVDGAVRPEIVMRFRPAPDSPRSDYRSFTTVPNQPVWPRARNLYGGRVCVQAGVGIGADILFESWTCLPINEAVNLSGERSGVDSTE
jgi:hypothetical protein